VGKFWRPVDRLRASGPGDVQGVRRAGGFAKTIYALGTRPTEEGKTLLSAIMRTASTDEPTRTWTGEQLRPLSQPL
jgi:hypothetical protein